MAAQAYSPFRTSLITAEQLRHLSTLDAAVPVRHTIIHWVLIVASFAACSLLSSISVYVIAFVVIGINLYGLYIIGHDGLHRRLFRSEAANDLWNDLFLVGPFGAITRINRANHMHHHQVTCLAEDPDRHKYTHDHKEPVVPFLAFLSGLGNLVPALRNVFLKKAACDVDQALVRVQGEKHRMRDWVILLGWQAMLLGGLSYFVAWWAYPILWLGPAYTFAYRGDLIRVFCEHSMQASDETADHNMRLVSFTSSWTERLFFAPHNMNLHMPHHLWPSIPYYNLPKADALIRSSLQAKHDARLVWRRSYCAYLISYFMWRLRQGGAAYRSATSV